MPTYRKLTKKTLFSGYMNQWPWNKDSTDPSLVPPQLHSRRGRDLGTKAMETLASSPGPSPCPQVLPLRRGRGLGTKAIETHASSYPNKGIVDIEEGQMVSFVDTEHPSCPFLGELLGCFIKQTRKNLQGAWFSIALSVSRVNSWGIM